MRWVVVLLLCVFWIRLTRLPERQQRSWAFTRTNKKLWTCSPAVNCFSFPVMEKVTFLLLKKKIPSRHKMPCRHFLVGYNRFQEWAVPQAPCDCMMSFLSSAFHLTLPEWPIYTDYRLKAKLQFAHGYGSEKLGNGYLSSDCSSEIISRLGKIISPTLWS